MSLVILRNRIDFLLTFLYGDCFVRDMTAHRATQRSSFEINSFSVRWYCYKIQYRDFRKIEMTSFIELSLTVFEASNDFRIKKYQYISSWMYNCKTLHLFESEPDKRTTSWSCKVKIKKIYTATSCMVVRFLISLWNINNRMWSNIGGGGCLD